MEGSRSPRIGPTGLEAVTETSGERRRILHPTVNPPRSFYGPRAPPLDLSGSVRGERKTLVRTKQTVSPSDGDGRVVG